MSETVAYIGKATPVRYTGFQTEEIAEMLVRNVEYNVNHYDSYIEVLINELSEQYFYYKKNDTIYLLENNKVDAEEIIYANGDEYEINYTLVYYNGGAGFDEVLEEAFDKIL